LAGARRHAACTIRAEEGNMADATAHVNRFGWCLLAALLLPACGGEEGDEPATVVTPAAVPGVQTSALRGIQGTGVTLQGIQGTGVQGIQGSGLQGIQGSGRQGIEGSGLQGIEGTGAK
jgi:hypothetical protein